MDQPVDPAKIKALYPLWLEMENERLNGELAMRQSQDKAQELQQRIRALCNDAGVPLEGWNISLREGTMVPMAPAVPAEPTTN